MAELPVLFTMWQNDATLPLPLRLRGTLENVLELMTEVVGFCDSSPTAQLAVWFPDGFPLSRLPATLRRQLQVYGYETAVAPEHEVVAVSVQRTGDNEYFVDFGSADFGVTVIWQEDGLRWRFTEPESPELWQQSVGISLRHLNLITQGEYQHVAGFAEIVKKGSPFNSEM